jgi:hypothetical protein
MRHLTLSFIFILIVQSVSGQGGDRMVGINFWPEITEQTKPWTRWWWMGSAVNEVDLRRLLEEYATKGFGGVEITPIYGVKGEEDQYIDFLSPEWMKMLSTTIEAAAQNHMGVDINTGTGWPFGGPQISSEFAAKRLKFYSIENAVLDTIPAFIDHFNQESEETLLALSGVSDNGQRINFLQQIGSLKELDEGIWHVYAATQLNTNQEVKRAAPGGEGLVFNHFSKDATRHYLDRFDAAMNHTNPGIRCFFNDSYELTDASSTSDLFEVFKEMKGYDLSRYLQELSGQGDKEWIARIKSDYRDVLGALILENFTKTWISWAHRYGARTRNQAHGSPANLIDLYSAVDIPEVETFNATRFPFLEEYLVKSRPLITESNALFKKLASSAAHMKGGTLVSCETFTWLNEHFKTALYQCKPEIDQLFTQGINHVVFHGTAYSPEEAAWPGWLFYASVHMEPNNPQWEDIEDMNRYIARCQSLLQLGEHTNDLLVYWSPDEYNHQTQGLELGLTLPTSDRWIHMPEIDQLNEKGYQFDFISDRIIGQSEVRGGRIYTYGRVPYRAIVLPYLERIRLSTFKKLLQMADEGASIVFSTMPHLVNGFNDFRSQEEELVRLAGSIKFVEQEGISRASYGKGWICMGELQKVLSSLDITRETLADFHIINISRRTADGTYYFIANQEKEPVDQYLAFKYGARNALFMNPMNGDVSLAESTYDGSSARVHVVLEPGASMIIYFTDQAVAGLKPHAYYTDGQHLELSNPWSFRPIAGVPELPLDTTLSSPVLWSELPGASYKWFAGTCEYSTQFDLDSLEGDSYLLRLEKVEASARVFVNGKKAGTLWCFPFEVEVGPFLKAGENELRIEVSNLGANAIRYLDRQGVNWKKFHDINFVGLDYRPFDASRWDILPSGLGGKAELIRLISDLQQ